MWFGFLFVLSGSFKVHFAASCVFAKCIFALVFQFSLSSTIRYLIVLLLYVTSKLLEAVKDVSDLSER